MSATNFQPPCCSGSAHARKHRRVMRCGSRRTPGTKRASPTCSARNPVSAHGANSACDELLSKLAHPKAATLVLYDGVPVATGFATDESTRRRKIAHGMYLYIVPAHRGRSKLAAFIMYTTLGVCVEAGYDQVLAFTDPTRLSALLLYLSNGARPVKQSLSCWWRWRKIERRLAPALKRAARRQVAHRGLEQDVLF